MSWLMESYANMTVGFLSNTRCQESISQSLLTSAIVVFLIAMLVNGSRPRFLCTRWTDPPLMLPISIPNVPSLRHEHQTLVAAPL